MPSHLHARINRLIFGIWNWNKCNLGEKNSFQPNGFEEACQMQKINGSSSEFISRKCPGTLLSLYENGHVLHLKSFTHSRLLQMRELVLTQYNA